MDYDEVSLVDVPANQHALVMITKRHDEGADMPGLFFEDGTPVDSEDELETGDVVYDEDGTGYEYTAPDDASELDNYELEGVGKAFGDGAREFARGLSREARRSRRPGAQAGFRGHSIEGNGPMHGPEIPRHIRAGHRAGRAVGRARDAAGNRKVQYGAAGLAGAGAVGAGVHEYREHTSKSFAEDIAKALSGAVTEADRDAVIEEFAKAYDAQQAELDALANIAKSERDLRLESEYVEVAKGLGLPGSPEELGPVLKRLSDAEAMGALDAGDVAVIAKTLDAVSGILYEEFGYSGSGPALGDPSMADAEAAAEARIAKSGNEPVSKAAGIEAYYADNPDAYDEYMAGRR